MTDSPQQQQPPLIAVHLKFQPPGAAAPTEKLAAVDQETLRQIDDLLAGRPAPVVTSPPLPGQAGEFVALLEKVLAALGECEAMYEANGITHPQPGAHSAAQIPLSMLRQFGGGPKQMAYLLNCHTGYFTDQGEDPYCLFSFRRFQPTSNFYELIQEKSDEKS